MLMANKMTTVDVVFFLLFLLLSQINGALFPGVNGIIAQGNNQQMEYAKWRGRERDRRQRRQETDRDRSGGIFLLKRAQMSLDPIRADKVGDKGVCKRQSGGATTTQLVEQVLKSLFLDFTAFWTLFPTATVIFGKAWCVFLRSRPGETPYFSFGSQAEKRWGTSSEGGASERKWSFVPGLPPLSRSACPAIPVEMQRKASSPPLLLCFISPFYLPPHPCI